MVKKLLLGAVLLLALSGCGPIAPPGENPQDPQPTVDSPSEELIGQGTVLQKDGSPPMFCLGPVMESYPPQCSGPEIIGWDWSAVEQEESSGGVTWGTYAVQGTWDGEAFTVTQPPTPLSLYDPPANFDPRADKNNPGAGDPAELEAIQQELFEADGPRLLTSSVENGYVFVTVVYDDGTLQEQYDARFGSNRVAVQSALQPANS